MRALLALLAVTTVARAEPASITIENSALWAMTEAPVSVRFAIGTWTTVAEKKSKTVSVAVAAKAIPIDVRAPATQHPFRRWAMILPGTKYRLVGNPCAMYGLELDPKPDASGESRMQVDATALPKRFFPLVIATDAGGEDEDREGITLDAPAISAPFDMPVSAMCARSGTPIVVYSKAVKRRIVDEMVIGHPGALHTLTVTKRGAFAITLAR